MAEIVVGAIITVFCEKLTSDLMKLARSEGLEPQLTKWKKTLPLIKAVLADAGKKQITDSAVKLWLTDLQDLAYDIDDVLDDLATEAMRRKLNQESHASTSTSKVFKFVPTCCTNFTPQNIMYGRKMSSKLDEITTKLNDLLELKNGLGLNMNVNLEISNRIKRWSEETSLVDESKIMGREEEKNELLRKLLGNGTCDRSVRIVSIVGMGGIGKTTLAKVLYNNEKVKEHFELQGWVCVSDEFHVFNISNTIFQEVGGEDKSSSSLNQLHEALKEKLSKKRFLLVLDDVWNEDSMKWESLQSPLVGAPGSVILVTTRDKKVASTMDADEVYPLELFSDEDALSLFAQNALAEKNFDKHPTLKFYGEGIVKKCKRLPLALKTVGRVLRGNTNGEEWEKVLKSEIWDITDASGILPALRLSYYHLPPHLKLLFAYCSLFPKDYAFDKKELVLLWIAEGFLSQSKCKKSMESLGHEYFEELESKSFFQHITNDQLGYSMHDLLNDLATSVAGEFFFRLDDEVDASNMDETFDRLRHFSVIVSPSGSYNTKLKDFKRARGMRTLLPLSVGWRRHDNVMMSKVLVLVELLAELQLLRVLTLPMGITEVPESIGNLKHLRYLNFSGTSITCLPEQVSDLYNLQSLLVRDCYMLSSLPKSLGKLINLRHLDMRNTPNVKSMPLGIGGLTSLQTLSKVITEGGNGFKISELKDLLNLQGKLSIKGLEKVLNQAEANDANLHQKKGLDVLKMQWSYKSYDHWNEMTEYEVLEGLRPHHNLKNLKISFYKGTRFPSWVGDPSFHQLTVLTLRGCRCTHLPTLGHLQSLKELYVEGMNEVKTLDFASLGITFQSLEVLKFEDMQGWERWSTSGGDDNGTATSFPCLREISITDCPKLAQVSIGMILSLWVLHIKMCSEAVLRSMVGVSSSLVELEMRGVVGLTQLHGEYLIHLGQLKDLRIYSCGELRYLWESQLGACKILVSLQELEVRYCEKLVSLGERNVNWVSLKRVVLYHCETLESYNCPNSVESLRVYRCPSMTSLTFSKVQEIPSTLTDSDKTGPTPEKGFGFLPLFRLRELVINLCNNLKSFPHEYLQSFTSLELLSIIDCPSMDFSFPCRLWPPNLRKLEIGGLKKPISELGQLNYPTSLVELYLRGENSGVVSFAVGAEDDRNTTASASSSFLLPPSLSLLRLDSFPDVESLSEVLKHLPRLKYLVIYNCPKLEKTSFPSSLTVRFFM